MGGAQRVEIVVPESPIIAHEGNCSLVLINVLRMWFNIVSRSSKSRIFQTCRYK